jgi:hypothetical protein
MTDIGALDPRWQALIRSVSKFGDFDLAGEELVDELSEILSDQEAVTLYVAIRDHSHRLEDEWRDEFIDAFPDSEPLLPAPLPESEYRSEYRYHVALRVADVGSGVINLDILRAVAKSLNAGQRLYHLTYPERVVYCFKTAEDAKTFAERFGGERPFGEDG